MGKSSRSFRWRRISISRFARSAVRLRIVTLKSRELEIAIGCRARYLYMQTRLRNETVWPQAQNDDQQRRDQKLAQGRPLHRGQAGDEGDHKARRLKQKHHKKAADNGSTAVAATAGKQRERYIQCQQRHENIR